MTYTRLCIILFLYLTLLSCSDAVKHTDISTDFPGYVRDTGRRTGVIVFVHGVIGNADSTWTNENSKAFWPQILTEDEVFNDFNIYVYEYPSPLFRTSLNQDEVAEKMRLDLEVAGVTEHSEIIFLVHSMGGIITRSFLLKYPDVADRVKFIYFFATPTTGSEIARIGKFLSKNKQFGRMVPINADSYLADMMRSWQAARFGIKSFCAYEKLPLLMDGPIVNMASATALCTEEFDPILATHIDIVKPQNKDSGCYKAFKNAFMKTRRSIAVKIIDGTTFEEAVNAAIKSDRSEGLVGSFRFVNCTPNQRSARLRTGRVESASVTLLIQRLAFREGSSFFGINVNLDERNRIYEIECIPQTSTD